MILESLLKLLCFVILSHPYPSSLYPVPIYRLSPVLIGYIFITLFSLYPPTLIPKFCRTMPFVDLQGKLGINMDRWLLLQSGEQPHKRAARCHAFEKEWIECSDGIGQTRAKKECKLEFEDFYECMHREKMVSAVGV